MVLLVAFAAVAQEKTGLRPLAVFFMWAFVIFAVASMALLVSCFFFDKPKTIPCLLKNECEAVQPQIQRDSIREAILKEALLNNWRRHMIIALDAAPEGKFCEGNKSIAIHNITLNGILCKGLKRHGAVEVSVSGKLTADEVLSRVPTIVSLVLNGIVCTTAVDCRFTASLEKGAGVFKLTHRTYADGSGTLTILLDLTGCITADPQCAVSVTSVRVTPLG